MAFDGFFVSALAEELNKTLSGGRISKIAQPERDALLLTAKNNSTQYRLLLSASASLPLAYLTDDNRPSPVTAPNFCMLLRKHLGSAKILSITQPGLERILQIHLEHLNDLGDICHSTLILELMGKHSNLIFCDGEGKILDSIKHISALVSSVREVLPGRPYFIPAQEGKLDPYALTEEEFLRIAARPLSCFKAIYQSLTGFSPCMANHVCTLAGVDADDTISELPADRKGRLYLALEQVVGRLRQKDFAPVLYRLGTEPMEFAAFPLSHFPELAEIPYSSVSKLLEDYYGEKDRITRIRQKSADLRHLIATALDRTHKKEALQAKQLADTEKRDKYKIYGELLTTYGYQAEEGAKSITVLNYYTNEDLAIPLNPELSALENAKSYFSRYSKLKRTFEAVTKQLAETREELRHLESISNALEIAVREDDLEQIRTELAEFGYIKHKAKGGKGKQGNAGKGGKRKARSSSHPFHYLTADGFHVYVGKNNYQNDELTFQFATGGDWWFHAKGIAGSHVILKAEGKEIPDRAFEDAARLAAHYSSAGTNGDGKVEVDYVEKKQVKKPGGGKPGFVVYYTNYSMVIDTDLSGLTLVED